MLGDQHRSGQIDGNDSVPQIFRYCPGRIKAVNDACIVNNNVDVLELAFRRFECCCYALRVCDIATDRSNSFSFVGTLKHFDELRVDVANDDICTGSVAKDVSTPSYISIGKAVV